ncbi:MAG: hypothetical protein EOO03_16995, partial [Chitinophagaceae bacterium]
MIEYMVKTVIAGLLFALTFRLLLQGRKSFRFNRVFLLAALCLTFLSPLIRLHVDIYSGHLIQPVGRMLANTTSIANSDREEHFANSRPAVITN